MINENWRGVMETISICFYNGSWSLDYSADGIKNGSLELKDDDDHPIRDRGRRLAAQKAAEDWIKEKEPTWAKQMGLT